jgi:UDP-N-acetylglucosamine 1-carboxyvinyltransferase
MISGHILVQKSAPLIGTIEVNGAKNAVLVIITSLILTDGISTLKNVPNNADVRLMIKLLEDLGALVSFDVEEKKLTVDTSGLRKFEVKADIMNKMRASILVMGPLLARFGKAKVAMPGGDLIGLRPINYHLEGFKKMGIIVENNEPFVSASLKSYQDQPANTRIVLEYPSVGATENLMMFATLCKGETVIINAALEPEVIDLIDILKKMGAHIDILPSATLVIKGVQRLNPVTHAIIPDRLEAGALIMAATITGGEITIPNARPDHLDIFLEKLKEMGHQVITDLDKGYSPMPLGITVKATNRPQGVSIKTGPYPGFASDLQPSMMAALCLAQGVSVVEETVYENRMIHAKELSKMGAQITVEGSRAIIRGVDALYGCEVIASDIRASCALVLAGLAAYGQTKMTGIHHWQRGYDKLEERLGKMGALIHVINQITNAPENQTTIQPLP